MTVYTLQCTKYQVHCPGGWDVAWPDMSSFIVKKVLWSALYYYRVTNIIITVRPFFSLRSPYIIIDDEQKFILNYITTNE